MTWRGCIALLMMLVLCMLILNACIQEQAVGGFIYPIVAVTAILLSASLIDRKAEVHKHDDDDGGDTL